MPVVATLLTNGTQLAASSATTASVSPSSNQLVLVCLYQKYSAGNPGLITVSGAGLTFDNVGSRISSSQNKIRITMVRALSASPGSGVLTLSSAETDDIIKWVVVQFANVDTTGSNGANAIVQNATGDQFAGSSTGMTVTLGAFSNSSNATFGVVGQDGTTRMSAGSNFTEIVDDQNNGTEVEAEFATTNQTAVNWTWSSANIATVAMAIEIKAAFTGGDFLNFLI